MNSMNRCSTYPSKPVNPLKNEEKLKKRPPPAPLTSV